MGNIQKFGHKSVHSLHSLHKSDASMLRVQRMHGIKHTTDLGIHPAND